MPVTKREAGFLRIGLRFGLLLSLAAILEFLLSLYKSALVTGYNWDKIFLLSPILLLAIGLALFLQRPRNPQDENRKSGP